MPTTPARPNHDRHCPEHGTSRKFRVDPGSGSGSKSGDGRDLAPGRGSLLRAFGAWGKRPAGSVPAEGERRSATRHHVECLSWIGWKGWRRFEMKDALLVNLSRGGAQIFLDTPPPTDRAVWVFLEIPGQTTTVKGRVLETRTTDQGQCLVRIRFGQPCPYAFFEAAVCGLAATDPKLRPAASPRARAGTIG